jgi:cell division protein ZapA
VDHEPAAGYHGVGPRKKKEVRACALDGIAAPESNGAVKRTVTLEIAGTRYKMTSDADEAHLARLAGIINERLGALGGKIARSASPAQLLAVVALGLADDLVASEDRRKKVEDTTKKTIAAAIDRIDRRLAERPPTGGA